MLLTLYFKTLDFFSHIDTAAITYPETPTFGCNLKENLLADIWSSKTVSIDNKYKIRYPEQRLSGFC